MAELTSQERLQPSLLDRLTDDDPTHRQESRDRRVLSLRRFREGVIRDLSWLLNTANLGSTVDVSDYPEVSRSVLNYGMPDLTGTSASGTEVATIERAIREAIWEFEPRILKQSVKVHVALEEGLMNHNALTLTIEGELWAQPVPEQLFLKTEIDLETGAVSVKDHDGRMGG